MVGCFVIGRGTGARVGAGVGLAEGSGEGSGVGAAVRLIGTAVIVITSGRSVVVSSVVGVGVGGGLCGASVGIGVTGTTIVVTMGVWEGRAVAARTVVGLVVLGTTTSSMGARVGRPV